MYIKPQIILNAKIRLNNNDLFFSAGQVSYPVCQHFHQPYHNLYIFPTRLTKKNVNNNNVLKNKLLGSVKILVRIAKIQASRKIAEK